MPQGRRDIEYSTASPGSGAVFHSPPELNGGQAYQGVLAAKPVKLILVGPDCSGKSNLAKRLVEATRAPVFANRRISDEMESLQKVVDFAVSWFPDSRFILDQWQFPVDIVYNNTLRDRRSIFEALAPFMKDYMDAHKVLIIHLTARPEVLHARYNRRGDELWNIKQILQVADAYEPWLQKLNLTHTTIDTSDLNTEGVFMAALARITKFYGGM